MYYTSRVIRLNCLMQSSITLLHFPLIIPIIFLIFNINNFLWEKK